MYLNTLQPAEYSKPKAARVGRGIGSGLGKTCGRGHKGQKARAGGYHKVGFEGGQMPLQRRLPKFGFTSKKSMVTSEVRLTDINRVDGDVVDLLSLRQADVVPINTQYIKIFASGEVSRALTIRGIRVTKGATAAIVAAGGRIE